MKLDEAKELKHGEELHYGECKLFIGPRGGQTLKVEAWRVNGAVKLWKKSPERVEIPLKHGLYDYGYIDEGNIGMFHKAVDCNPKEVKK